MNDPNRKCFSVDFRRMAFGIFQLLLIGVVIYGMNDHVYDGFGKGVPWVIMVLFAVMGIIRIVESVTGISVISYLREGSSADSE